MHLDALVRPLNATLYDMSNSECVRNLAKVAFRSWLVFHNRVAADNFQIRDFGQVIPDLILNPHGEERFFWIGSRTFKGQNGNALFYNSANGRVVPKPNS